MHDVSTHFAEKILQMHYVKVVKMAQFPHFLTLSVKKNCLVVKVGFHVKHLYPLLTKACVPHHEFYVTNQVDELHEKKMRTALGGSLLDLFPTRSILLDSVV
eukprot:TRINITY_DN18849_c0_g1_i1.p1 TRINITY_DN18849_c0_g1~~TRINITY_DN18849_c0_g1_i1.p1  ORF type:complete len:102 (+),score=11.50 TRINITY_DN18849_c0_g1_i1:59-364(+)